MEVGSLRLILRCIMIIVEHLQDRAVSYLRNQMSILRQLLIQATHRSIRKDTAIMEDNKWQIQMLRPWPLSLSLTTASTSPQSSALMKMVLVGRALRWPQEMAFHSSQLEQTLTTQALRRKRISLRSSTP